MKKFKFLTRTLAICLSLFLLIGCSSKTPQNDKPLDDGTWKPDHDITIRVPAGAGGAFDIAARIFAKGVQEAFGTTVIVTNLTGAGGSIAAADLNQHDPNPAEMMGGNIGMFTVAPLFSPDIAMNLDDYQIVTSLISDEYVICTAPGNTNIKTWEDLVNYTKDNKLIVSTASPGDTTHALMTALFGSAGIDNYAIVTNDAGNQRLTSTVAGDVDITVVPAPVALQFVQEGSVMPIASFSNEPTTYFDGIVVPNVKSLGYDYVFRTNNFIMVRNGVDQKIVDEIANEYKAWQDTEDFKALAKESNFEPYTFDGETTTAEIKAAADMFKEIYNTYY